ncbi:MAG TPA: hypothetical protein VGR62_03355 [Candidatus Binatia bacterium]|nr:hypothetical protein [Candidatus Binatia bacterium]
MKTRLVVAISLVLLPVLAGAGDTDVDPTFGVGGQIRLSATSPLPTFPPADVAEMPDGRLVTATPAADLASITITRLLSDGSLDPTFGIGGHASLPVAGDSPQVRRVLLPADGGVILFGRFVAAFDEGLARFDASGTLDPTFGSGGVLIIPSVGMSSTDITAILAANGDIVTLGEARETISGTDTSILVRRFLGDGTPAPGFGVGGKVLLNPSTEQEIGRAIVEQPNGALVIAANFEIVRLLANGSPDPTFGTGGVVPSFARAVQLLSDGDIVALVGNAAPNDLVIERRNPNGTLDPAFGTGGTVAVEHLSDVLVTDLVVDASDRTTVFGTSLTQWRPVTVLARFGADGILDTTLGPCGYGVVGVQLELPRYAQQSDGRFLIVGFDRFTTSTTQVGMARLGTPDAEAACLGPFVPKGSTWRMRVLRGGTGSQWSWKSGGTVTAADIGNPLTGSSYGLCILDLTPAIPQLLLASALPPQGLCAGKPCWKRTASGQIRYSLSDGRTQLTFKPGTAKKAKLTWKTNETGPFHLAPADVAPISVPVPLVLRLARNDGAQCWDAVHAREVKNGGTSVLLTSN